MKKPNENLLLKVVVGSRLHGLENPESDYDYRGVFLEPAIAHLSPFRKVRNNAWIEGDVDDTTYELSYFCKMLTQGNPSALEVLWSNKIESSSELGEKLCANKDKFLDAERIFEAHKGYALNQLKKMNLFNPDDRTPKFAVAYVRSMQQGIELLNTGSFSPQVIRNRDLLLEVKHHFDADKHVQKLGEMFSELSKEIIEARIRTQLDKPDLEWIENFLLEAYKY